MRNSRKAAPMVSPSVAMAPSRSLHRSARSTPPLLPICGTSLLTRRAMSTPRPDRPPVSTSSRRTARPASSLRRRSCRCRRWWSDSDGAIYAATSPDGKVYKLVHGGPAPGKTPEGSHTTAEVAAAQEGAKPGPAGENPSISVAVDSSYSASVYFDPKTKYIWALALDRQGQLYIGTGDRGELFRVDRAAMAASSSRATKPRFAPSTSTIAATSSPAPTAVA